jgi:Ca2+-transporting ATPase
LILISHSYHGTPPKGSGGNVFPWDVKAFVLFAIIIECPIFLGIFYHEFDHPIHARTEIFFMFVIIELIIALNFRSMRYSLFNAPPHKWLLMAIVWELLLITLLIQFPAIRDAFGILRASGSDLTMILAVGLLVLISIEVVEAVLPANLKAGRGHLLNRSPK